MKRLLANAFLVIFGAWLVLLDRCLIVSSGMPVSGKILTLLALQLLIGVAAALMANGAFPAIGEAIRGNGSARWNVIVFVVPALLFLASPLLVSESMYGARYGYEDRILVNSHVGHDLRCCWNPLAHVHLQPALPRPVLPRRVGTALQPLQNLRSGDGAIHPVRFDRAAGRHQHVQLR
jgi:hypothetical protein